MATRTGVITYGSTEGDKSVSAASNFFLRVEILVTSCSLPPPPVGEEVEHHYSSGVGWFVTLLFTHS